LELESLQGLGVYPIDSNVPLKGFKQRSDEVRSIWEEGVLTGGVKHWCVAEFKKSRFLYFSLPQPSWS
jgi:hypothetical protein